MMGFIQSLDQPTSEEDSVSWWSLSNLAMDFCGQPSAAKVLLGCVQSIYIPWQPPYLPKGRPRMSDVPLLSGISGLSFDSPFLSPLLFFLPSPLALSVLSFFC